MITLTQIGGLRVVLNPTKIAEIVECHPNRHGINCVVYVEMGRTYEVQESRDQIAALIREPAMVTLESFEPDHTFEIAQIAAMMVTWSLGLDGEPRIKESVQLARELIEEVRRGSDQN